MNPPSIRNCFGLCRPVRAALVLALLEPNLAAQNQAPAANTQRQVAGAWKNPEEVYAKNCGLCHDTGVGPVIKGRHLPPELFVNVVRHGLRAMPAFRQTDIDDTMLKRLADMLARSEASAKQPAKSASK